MSHLWLVALVPVVGYCLVRAVLPSGPRTAGHGRDVYLWHVAMGVAMAAMIVGRMTGHLALAVVIVAAVGAAWSVVVLGRTPSATHARVTVGAFAMALTTLPLATAQAAGASTGMSGMSDMGTISGINGMRLPAGSAPGVVLAVLMAALTVAALTRLPAVVRRAGGATVRLDAGCDVVMAAAMFAMLAALV